MTALALAAAFLAPRPARAWGAAGHEVAALIAQDRLSSAALDKVHAIFGPSVGLDMVSTCADLIKHGSVNCAGDFYLKEDSATDDWHFIDIPIADAPGALSSYCAKSGGPHDCVVDQISLHLAVLKDPRSSRKDRQVALMFLVHLVADEHQPLHCATDRGPDGTDDRGGNGKPVDFNPANAALTADEKRAMNLHHLWDNIVNTDAAEKALDRRALASRLESDMDTKDVSTWLSGDYVTGAALESFTIARDVIYKGYAADHGRGLGQAYQDAMQPVAYERLEQAGARLAGLLEGALAGP